MAIEILRPNGNRAIGGVDEYTVTGAVNKWDAVDESSPDDDTTYLEGAASVQQWLSFPDSTEVGAGTINSVTVKARAKRTGAAGQLELQLVDEFDTYGDGAGEDTLTASYAEYDAIFTLDPRDSTAWTVAKINAFEDVVFKAGAGGTIRVTQAWVEIDYTPVSGGPSVIPVSRFQRSRKAQKRRRAA